MFLQRMLTFPTKNRQVCTFRDYVASYQTIVGDVGGLFKYESVVMSCGLIVSFGAYLKGYAISPYSFLNNWWLKSRELNY